MAGSLRIFLKYGRSRKAMTLDSRTDNQLFAMFITLISDSGACYCMITELSNVRLGRFLMYDCGES